jgi:hypothetical protein
MNTSRRAFLAIAASSALGMLVRGPSALAAVRDARARAAAALVRAFSSDSTNNLPRIDWDARSDQWLLGASENHKRLLRTMRDYIPNLDQLDAGELAPKLAAMLIPDYAGPRHVAPSAVASPPGTVTPTNVSRAPSVTGQFIAADPPPKALLAALRPTYSQDVIDRAKAAYACAELVDSVAAITPTLAGGGTAVPV